METIRICPGCQKPLAADAADGMCPECLLKAGLGTGVEVGPDSRGPGGRTAFVAPAPDEVARLFPQLEILGFLGQGGMGAVYKARQKELDRVVALKILPPGVGKDPAFAERFTREARALAKLNHPGIVTLYEFGKADGLFFFLMEFVDGMSLRRLLEVGRIAAREALAIVPQICDALQYAHDQGIVHRDIKPENVLLDRRGRVKVADFGLAKIVGAEAETAGGSSGGMPGLTEAGRVMGTPQYMAPEQREHPTEVDHRADIYSLGVVFYQMLTGELPGKPIELPSRKVQVDVRLDEVVLHALEKEPELRYQQASQVKTAVETIAMTGSAAASAPPVDAPLTGTAGKALDGGRARPEPRFPRVRVAALTANIGLLLMIAWYILTGDSFQPEALDWLVLVLALASPVVSIVALVPGRARGGTAWTVAVIANVALVAAIFAYLATYKIQHRGSLDGGELLLFAVMLFAPTVSVIALVTRRAAATRPNGGLATSAAQTAAVQPDAKRALENARSQVRVPAIGMIVISCLTLFVLAVAIPLGAYGAAINTAGAIWAFPWAVVIPPALAMAVCNIVALEGARRMKQLRSYPWGVVGSILLILSPLCGLLGEMLSASWGSVAVVLPGLVFGIWALIVLSRREVQEAFGQARVLSAPGTPQPNRGGRAGKVVLASAVLALCGVTFVMWAQRPRELGTGVVDESPDGRYQATASTYHSMRILGGDKTYYRFTLQGSGGFRKREVPVPFARLATNYMAVPLSEVSFGDRKDARIQWSTDGRKVSFLVRDFEVWAFYLATTAFVRGASSHTTNNLSVVVFGDNNDRLSFALFYAGNVKSHLQGGSKGGDVDLQEGSIALPNGELFVVRWESSNPEQLHINGRDFDLGSGCVLVLRDDGTVEQLSLFPPLAVARDVEQLARLIAARRGNSKVTGGPPLSAEGTPQRLAGDPSERVVRATAAGDTKEEEVFPSSNSGDIVQGANLTWRNYVQWWNETRGTPLGGDLELGANLWAEGIARLKPEYVYTHGVNIVVVRSRQGEDEEGFYVALSIASSPGPSDGQFTRMLIAQHAGGAVFTFRRRGHFERTEANELKRSSPDKVTGANAGGSQQLPVGSR